MVTIRGGLPDNSTKIKSTQPNAAIIAALEALYLATLAAATAVETCRHQENPEWHRVIKLIDDYSDDLLEMQQSLIGAPTDGNK